MLEKISRLIMLFDFYGPLLTERQRQALEMHYEADLSLSEVAQEMGISRQGVFDLLRKTEKKLEGYEARLGLLQKFEGEKEKMRMAYDLLQQKDDAYSIGRAIQLLEEALEIEGSQESR